MDAELIARLDALDAKLDYVVERQRFTEEFIRDMTPVGREAMTAIAARMAEWEARGWFTLGNELVALFDRVANAYGPDDVRELSDSIVQIIDTVRNVTQPDVLEFANEATDVLHHADDIQPVGPFRAMGAVGDKDVQKGLGVALEILRHLGKAREAAEAPRRERPAPKAKAAPAAEKPATPSPKLEPQPLTPPPTEVVEWEGRKFTSEGFLLDASTWDEALAGKMAAGLGLQLTDEHWAVIRWVRQEYASSHASPNVRKMATGSGVGTKRMYELFPGTPGKTAAMIAGIPKPVGCV